MVEADVVEAAVVDVVVTTPSSPDVTSVMSKVVGDGCLSSC